MRVASPAPLRVHGPYRGAVALATAALVAVTSGATALIVLSTTGVVGGTSPTLDPLPPVLAAPGGETRYRRCRRTEHHHHLVCRRCGRTVEVAETAVERWAAQTARRHGFTEVSHVIELHGTCETCRQDA